MIGVYDYTVILTYMSAISAGIGIIVALSGNGHPYLGTFFLLFCGLCDAFDGKVARTKKNRSDVSKRFGIQIDSLSDLVAFGVLPGCIAAAMIRVSPRLPELPRVRFQTVSEWMTAFFLLAIICWYILTALIRLAYYNVTEEIRQNTETGNRKFFEGLPVTSAALIFPFVMLLQYITNADITVFYFIAMVLVSFAFVSKIKVPKPQTKGILVMIAIGFVEFVILAIFWFLRK